MRKLLLSIGRLGVTGNDSIEKQLVKYAANLCFVSAFLMALSWAVIGAFITLSIVYSTVSMAIAISYGFTIAASALGYFNGARRLFALTMAAHLLSILLLVGPYQGVEYGALLLLLLPTLMFDQNERREHLIILSFEIIAIAAIYYFSHQVKPFFELSPVDKTVGYFMNLIGIVGVSYLVIHLLNANMIRFYASLKREREKSKATLRRVLPSSIVERIGAGDETAAGSHSDAGILFADIVNFSGLSSSVTPQHLVDFLNALYCEFDDLARLHGVEKIKTIGDNYMAATGLLPEREADLEDLFEMASEMISIAKFVGRRFGFDISIRIGISAGPAISGVMGNLKKTFDVWGASVNLASHLESTGTPDRIHVSESAYWRLRHRWLFEEQNIDSIKGFGHIKTYLFSGQTVEEVDNSVDFKTHHKDR
jgi:class 3 adenylate cyclase